MAAARAGGSPGRDQQGGVAEHLGQRPDRGGHDRHPDGHGLEGRESEPLVTGRVDEHGRARQQGPDVVHPAEAPHPVAVGGAGDGPLELVLPPAAGSGDAQLQVGVGPGQLVEGRHQAGKVLAGLRPCPARAGRAATRTGPAAADGSRRRLDPGRNHPDPGRVDAEVIDDLGRDRLGPGVHPGPWSIARRTRAG